MEALIKRVNRVMRHDDEQIHVTRGERLRAQLGDYHTRELLSGAILRTRVDVEKLARRYNVLREGETVAA